MVAALTALSYLYIRDFPIRTAYLELLPQRDPLVLKFQAVEQEMASTDVIAVLLTLASPPPDMAERGRILIAAAERVIRELDVDRAPDLVAASYRVGEGISIPPELLIFRTASPAELDRLRAIARAVQAGFPLLPTSRPVQDLLADPASTPEAGAALLSVDAPTARATLAQAVAAGHATLDLLEGILARQGLLAEAAAISQAILNRPSGEEIGEPILSRDRSRLVVQIRPTRRPFESLPYNQAVTRAVRDAVARARLDELGVSAGITGTYVATVEADALIRRDMRLVTIVSSLAVFGLVFGAFASLLLCLAAIVPVLVSALFTMVWAKFAVGGFNLLTVFLPALILGLGIDYSVHILSRYVEERTKGQKAKEALVTAVRTKGGACLTAAVTTAAVFSCLLLSHSRALWEMGAITGVGILASLLTTFLLTPALVALTTSDRRLFRKRPIGSTTALRPAYRRLLRLRPGVVVVGLILTGSVLYQASRVQFRFVSQDLAPLTPAEATLAILNREFAGEVWIGDSFRFFVASPEDIAPVERMLAGHPLVRSTSSARALLPQVLVGGETLALDLPAAEVQQGVEALRKGLENWNQILGRVETKIVELAKLEFVALLQGRPALAEALSQGSDRLFALLAELEKVDAPTQQARLAEMAQDLHVLADFVARVAGLPAEPQLLDQILDLLPAEVRTQYRTTTGRYVVEARMSLALRESRNLRAFLDWADGLGVDRLGVPEVTARLEEYMRRDFLLSTALAVAIIFLLVWRDFPQPSKAALTLTPLAMGYVWMLAGMNLLRIPFNFTNIVISPLLIGIGVDGAVHLLHRVEEERLAGGDAAVRGAAASAVPIAVSSLTTMASFGALLAAHTPGLRLLGSSALLGLGFTLLWSLTFLPAAAALLVEKRRPKE